MEAEVICCQCGDVVRGVVCHDADGCHSLHFGCDGRHLSHCHCAGYPLAVSPCRVQDQGQENSHQQGTKRDARRALADISNIASPPPLSLPTVSPLSRKPRLTLHDIDVDDTSPNSASTHWESPSSGSPAGSCDDASSLDFGDAYESGIVVHVLALSGRHLCEVAMASSSLVVGLKIKLESILQVPVSQQELVYGFRQLRDSQALDHIVAQEGEAFSMQGQTMTVNLVSKAAPPRPNFESDGETGKSLVQAHRSKTVDWLISVHNKKKLPRGSLFQTINFLDAYLSQTRVSKNKMQLVGMGALHLASRCQSDGQNEADGFPRIVPQDLIQYMGLEHPAFRSYTVYTVDEVLNMEQEIADVLQFKDAPCSSDSDTRNMQAHCHPTVSDFLAPFFCMELFSRDHLQLIAYLAEHALMSLRLLRYDPSRIAAAAVLSSNRIMRWDPVWPPAVARKLPYTEDALTQCCNDLDRVVSCLGSPSSAYKALQEKYDAIAGRCLAPAARAMLGGA